MRRKDREITDRSELDAVLMRAEVGCLGLVDGDEPYVVPVNYGYRDGRVYIHCALEGRKLDLIAENPRVCFTVFADDEAFSETGAACDWTSRYRSVVAVGTARLLEGAEDKAAALAVIVSHYSGRAEHVAAEQARAVAVIEIALDRVTGKAANV